jgi:thioredoxin-like negative regulator of GroEL
MPIQSRHRRNLSVAAAVLLTVLAGMAWHKWGRAEARAERLLLRALDLREAGDDERAEASAAAALKLKPDLAEAALLAAVCASDRHEYQSAVDYLRLVTSGDAATRLRAALLEARLNHYRLRRMSDAELAYRRALELNLENHEANEGLARLLGLCGRRDEAIPYVLRLISLGYANDLLVMLARDSGALRDPEVLQRARQAAADDPNPLLGQAWEEAAANQTESAIELLQEALRRDRNNAHAHVALGSQLLALRRFDELKQWSESLPEACDENARGWMVRAQLAEHFADTAGAIRCYWEALRRAPESRAGTFRLARLLEEEGRKSESLQFADHLRRLQVLEPAQDRVLFANEQAGIDSVLELARSYESVGRLWEAWGWCQLAIRSDGSSEIARREGARLERATQGLPLRQTTDAANVAMAVDLSEYPVPRFSGTGKPNSPSADGSPTIAATDGNVGLSALTFRDEASAVGLQFRYFNGTAGPLTRRMFEFTGGGVGVLDFDCDGLPDVYFTQGVPWPPGGPVGEYGDRLFRNHKGARFDDVSVSSGIKEEGFGQGVTVGDVDADGFPDLYVANIGANQLWRNNGDGTFSDGTPEGARAENKWTTSCLLADLSGDGLPDIYDVNYVTDDDVYERVCLHEDNSPRACTPMHFESQADQFWLNDGEGGFRDATTEMFTTAPPGKGLGILAWDADGSGRLSFYVANDTTPSFFFVPDAAAGSRFRLTEAGIASGLALNGDGKATGSMGIALGDANEDGRLDMFVTNFLGESNTFFLNAGDGAYEDRTGDMGLRAPSLEMLGFGTQFLDADLDGRLELFVSNGHVDDLRSIGRPYKMRAQLFRWNGAKFVELPAAEVGPYFQKTWLGRPAARLDWNRDGLEDLIVGHLDEDSALLTNETREHGRFVALKLVGIQGGREAIGATVTARVGERSLARPLTAGDGYQASNERRLILGLGQADRLTDVVILWPGGREQSLGELEAGTEYIVVEGSPALAAPAIRGK